MAYEVLNTRTDIETPSTGIDSRRALASALTGVLADSFILMIKSQSYHWNVVGPLFKPIHELTEEQYRDVFEAIDRIAERIRALGQVAPLGMIDMFGHAELNEETSVRSAHEMVLQLVDDHETLARRFRDLAASAGDAGDGVTEDLANARMDFHEKAVWMLRAMIAE